MDKKERIGVEGIIGLPREYETKNMQKMEIKKKSMKRKVKKNGNT